MSGNPRMRAHGAQMDLFRKMQPANGGIDWGRFMLKPDEEIRRLEPKDIFAFMSALRNIGVASEMLGSEFSYRKAIAETANLAKALSGEDFHYGLKVTNHHEMLAAIDVCALMPGNGTALGMLRYMLTTGQTEDLAKGAARGLVAMFFNDSETHRKLERLSLEIKGATCDLAERKHALFEMAKELFAKLVGNGEASGEACEKAMRFVGREFARGFHVLVDQALRNRWIYD